jgi:hypothetical protein
VPKGVFEAESFVGGAVSVLVKPMIESSNAVELRAKQAGVDPATLKPTAYGLRIYELEKDPQVGTAFMVLTSAYNLASRRDQLIVDETYFRCTGFVSRDVLSIEETGYSRYYSSTPANVGRLRTLAEAVQNGHGHREAYEAFQPLSDMLRDGGDKENEYSKRMTWLAGTQSIEDVEVEVTPSPDFGNRVRPRFMSAESR